ncbi:MAG: putative signal transducing protein [Sphingosinicella sp.]|uniref:putative signal transducing protein n=1 Tax=Sphingosinicella sp. TaxID=1917971 RepID=UPI004037F2E7
MALIEAARYFTRFEASLAKGRLDAADIPSFLFDMEMNWGGADLGVVPARLMVDDEDLTAAQAILAEEGDQPK